MRIFIDIGHPAHVHYFRNFIKIMESDNHSFFITAREKDVTFDLLAYYDIAFIDRGKGRKGLAGKFLYTFVADKLIFKLARKFKPDLFISFSSPYAAHVATIMNIPHIAFNDTEAAKLGILSFQPFSKIVLTPNCYSKDFGKKHHRFKGLMELSYLHPEYFTPDISIYKILGIQEGERYAILRFVSWEASHDMGQSGLSIENKKLVIDRLSAQLKVFISSESKLPDYFSKYQISIPPNKMHDALAFADLYIGESPTMTTEAALLGTPAICISSWACNCGNFQDLKNHDLIYCFTPENENRVIDKAVSILQNENSKVEWMKKKNNYIIETIDINMFMANFVTDYLAEIKK